MDDWSSVDDVCESVFDTIHKPTAGLLSSGSLTFQTDHTLHSHSHLEANLSLQWTVTFRPVIIALDHLSHPDNHVCPFTLCKALDFADISL